ncbi:M56 family metallopeptidase [Paenibacillus senegalensis]|uniref:M56 family metallopeptidase n=1 Tax=Paenibacillus senegalensis TaxID=1465766 RepID=UPI000289B40A|nr:M56 family metallopeptidase [Paenibacillus senegalensis]
MDFLQMGLSASILIVVVVIIRALALHKLPKKTFLVLWGVVTCRLLLPLSIPFSFSFYTGMEKVKHMIMERAGVGLPVEIAEFSAMERIKAVGEAVGEVVGKAAGAPVGGPAGAAASIAPFSWIGIIWLTGVWASALFFITVYIKFRREFQTSLPVKNDFIAQWLQQHPLRRTVQVRQSDRIQTPLTYGILRPVILLPKNIDLTDEAALRVILTHELVHIRRFDVLAKWVLTIAVCVHWYNPFVWVMYILANRDIELSCDEKVVRTFGETMKSAYAMMLVNMKEAKSGLPLLVNHFSKNCIEERIVAIMKMKKASLAGIFLAMALVVGTVSVFATNAASTTASAGKEQKNTTDQVPEMIAAQNSSGQNNSLDITDSGDSMMGPEDGPAPKEGSIHSTGATIIPTFTDNSTHMDVELIQGGAFVIGRETWEEGDEVVFRVHAEEEMVLYVGVVPVEGMEKGLGYNGYGLFAPKEIQVGPEVQQVSFTIPETGEYGFGVQNYDRENGTLSFELEINKVFINPFRG